MGHPQDGGKKIVSMFLNKIIQDKSIRDDSNDDVLQDLKASFKNIQINDEETRVRR